MCEGGRLAVHAVTCKRSDAIIRPATAYTVRDRHLGNYFGEKEGGRERDLA